MSDTMHIARCYDDPDRTQGATILFDRMWPRGISKEALDHDDWDGCTG
ncbi:MAG: hypothetical protein ACOC9Q_03350 [bacterium]